MNKNSHKPFYRGFLKRASLDQLSAPEVVTLAERGNDQRFPLMASPAAQRAWLGALITQRNRTESTPPGVTAAKQAIIPGVLGTGIGSGLGWLLAANSKFGPIGKNLLRATGGLAGAGVGGVHGYLQAHRKAEALEKLKDPVNLQRLVDQLAFERSLM